MKERGDKKVVVGVVTSDKMDKTIAVSHVSLVQDRRFGKYVRMATVYKAHDEENKAELGDKVEIVETRPLSKTKRWRLVRVLDTRKAEALPESVTGGREPSEAVAAGVS